MRKSRGPKLWSANFVRVCLLTVLTGIGVQTMIASFPLYLKDLGHSAAVVGTVASCYTVAELLTRMVVGRLLDGVGRRAVALVATVVFALPLVGYLCLPLLGVLAALRFLQGFGSSTLVIDCPTMAADVLPPERMEEGVSYSTVFTSVATALGPILGVSMMQRGWSKPLFFILMGLMAASALLLIPMRYEKQAKDRSPEKATSHAAPRSGFWLWKYLEPTALPVALVAFLMSFSVAAVWNFLSLYGVEMQVKAVGFAFSVLAVFEFFSRIFSVRLAREIGQRRSAQVGLAVMLAACLVLFFARGSALFFVGAALFGVGGGLTYPVLAVICFKHVTWENRGKALCTYYGIYDMGYCVACFVCGFLVDMVGYYMIYGVGAILLGLSVVCGRFLDRETAIQS